MSFFYFRFLFFPLTLESPIIPRGLITEALPYVYVGEHSSKPRDVKRDVIIGRSQRKTFHVQSNT